VESSFRIARVGGIEIGASWSWLIVFGIVVWSLATAVLPAAYPDLGAGAHLAMAVVTAVLFFASILLHELGHAGDLGDEPPVRPPLHIAASRSLYLASHWAACSAAPNRCSPCSCSCMLRTMARGGPGVPRTAGSWEVAHTTERTADSGVPGVRER
jgi:hypothetical protein